MSPSDDRDGHRQRAGETGKGGYEAEAGNGAVHPRPLELADYGVKQIREGNCRHKWEQ
jgi:hypothetical protein